MLQRLIGHERPEIRSADADVDHVADALARMTLPGAAAESTGEIRHPVQDGMDVGHHIPAVVNDGGTTRRAQGYVKHCAFLRDVDLVAPEHGVDAIPQPRLSGKLKQ